MPDEVKPDETSETPETKEERRPKKEAKPLSKSEIRDAVREALEDNAEELDLEEASDAWEKDRDELSDRVTRLEDARAKKRGDGGWGWFEAAILLSVLGAALLYRMVKEGKVTVPEWLGRIAK